MRRESCPACLRPLKTCICKYIQPTNNHVQLIILQHPLEVYETKNTARLLNLCLQNSHIFVGEEFTDDFFDKDIPKFVELNAEKVPIYDVLLYPETLEEKSLGIQSPPKIADNVSEIPALRLWVLDATWRKSRKMLYLNPILQSMPRLSLQDAPPSIYKIRKAHSENQLSTLEASCYALRQLEQNLVDYAPILKAFSAFIAEQETYLPSR